MVKIFQVNDDQDPVGEAPANAAAQVAATTAWLPLSQAQEALQQFHPFDCSPAGN